MKNTEVNNEKLMKFVNSQLKNIYMKCAIPYVMKEKKNDIYCLNIGRRLCSIKLINHDVTFVISIIFLNIILLEKVL